jgi:hypothetical protein
MSDRLLRELGDLARSEAEAEKARFDDRWDRLAAGTLTAEEETELKDLAESSTEYKEAYEAFRPLGAEFQARVVGAIQSKQAEERQGKSQKRTPPDPPFPPVPVPPRPRVWAGFAAAAVAVGVFLPGVFILMRMMDPLPHYEASLTGGFKTNRGVETSPPTRKPVFTPGSPFNLELNPKESLEHPGKVKPRAFLSSSAGREPLRPLPNLENKFEPGETGSVRLNATMGEDIKVKSGDWIFWTVVARNSPPQAKEIEAHLRAHQPQDASWQTLCDSLHNEEKPPPSRWQVACVGFQAAEGQPDP